MNIVQKLLNNLNISAIATKQDKKVISTIRILVVRIPVSEVSPVRPREVQDARLFPQT